MSTFPYCACDIYLKLEQKHGWNKLWIMRKWNTISQIKFKTAMLKSSLCDYSEAYVLVKETISVANTAVSAATSNTKKLCSINWLHYWNKQYTSSLCQRHWCSNAGV